jgi:hypothetical protein
MEREGSVGLMREGGEEVIALRCVGGEGEAVHGGDGSVLEVGDDPSWARVAE